MQTFDPFWKVHNVRRGKPAPQPSGHSDGPAFSEVMGEMSVVLLICLSLAAAAAFLVPAITTS